MKSIYPLLILCIPLMILSIEIRAMGTPQTIVATLKVTDISCFGGNDGSAAVTVSGGKNYTYLWSNGQKTPTITNLTVGTYAVTVISGTQIATASARVSQPMALIGSIVQPNSISCANPITKISVNISGGNLPYFYNWSTGATTSSISVDTEGRYRVMITDSKGCKVTQDVNVGGNCIVLPFSLTTKTTNVSCLGGNNGSATVTALGGTTYSYAWSSGHKTQTATNLVAGTYTVTVTSGTQTKTATVSISQPKTGIIGSISTPYPISCASPSVFIYASATGGDPPYTYNWSTGGDRYYILAYTEGGYRVTITDSKGCSVTQAVRTSGSCRNAFNMGAHDNSIDTHVPFGIEKAENWILSPNPTSNQVSLAYQFQTASDAHVEVKSASGHIIEQRILRGVSAGQLSFETDNWANGLYFISLKNDETVQTKMLMVVH